MFFWAPTTTQTQIESRVNIFSIFFYLVSLQHVLGCKDHAAPFPWKKPGAADIDSGGKPLPTHTAVQDVSETSGLDEKKNALQRRDRFTAMLDDYQRCFPHFAQELAESKALQCISFDLPQIEVPAGKVLRHSVLTVERLFKAHSPMIFKVGFTHSPSWRWSNSVYGYSSSKDRWSNMVVIYMSQEPYSPAMLEAALIEKFGSDSPARFTVSSFFLLANPCNNLKVIS